MLACLAQSTSCHDLHLQVQFIHRLCHANSTATRTVTHTCYLPAHTLVSHWLSHYLDPRPPHIHCQTVLRSSYTKNCTLLSVLHLRLPLRRYNTKWPDMNPASPQTNVEQLKEAWLAHDHHLGQRWLSNLRHTMNALAIQVQQSLPVSNSAPDSVPSEPPWVPGGAPVLHIIPGEGSHWIPQRQSQPNPESTQVFLRMIL